jgi:hypothetical protein
LQLLVNGMRMSTEAAALLLLLLRADARHNITGGI